MEHGPASDAGWQAWDVMLRCAGQIRAVPGFVLGIDFGAALAIGTALGYDAIALAELLPPVRSASPMRSTRNCSVTEQVLARRHEQRAA